MRKGGQAEGVGNSLEAEMGIPGFQVQFRLDGACAE